MKTEHGVEATKRMPNGPGAAALLSAGLASFVMALLAVIGDHSAGFKKAMVFYTPTGALSGVTTVAVAVWIAAWVALDVLWRRSDSKGWAITVGMVLMGIGFVLMIPAVGDLF